MSIPLRLNELSPTHNRWTFILLDTSSGISWQVQWSQDEYEHRIWQIRLQL